MRAHWLVLFVLIVSLTRLLAAQSLPPKAVATSLTIHVDRPGIKVSPTLYGIFFEEINRSGDGGLYAEMIENRSFEDGDTTKPWELEKGDSGAAISIDRGNPLNDRNPRALKIDSKSPRAVRLINRGFHGIAVKQDAPYVLSLFARSDSSFHGPIIGKIVNDDGRVLASGAIPYITGEWKRYELPLLSSDSQSAAHLEIELSSPGTLWLDMVSLMPKQTWKDHNLRADLAQLVADIQPGFVRFPGGCWVEGEITENAYRWKNTIGPVEQRKTVYNLWKYSSTNALGYHEYLQWCEDMGAAPLFVINCGMSHRGVVPMEQMGEYVQDALDAIEYANGPAGSKWGALRAKAGHPKPFNLKYMEIGNENGGPRYNERYALFYDAIKKTYPDMNLVANLWNGKPNSRPIEILDEHYYSAPGFFISNANKYDTYDRKGPKIYVGEYAVTQGCGLGNLKAAVAEAAFMTGMERNSDIVTMSSYAPLLANPPYKAWNPNAINFDAARSYGTPSYYVQKMFAESRPDVVLPVEIESAQVESAPHRGMVGVGTWVTQAEFKDLKVTAGDQAAFSSDFANNIDAMKRIQGEWQPRDGAIAQTSNREGCFAVTGDTKWSDYTYSLKAKKTGGNEGFLIPFHWADEKNYAMWNLGGWGNVRHQIEVCTDGQKSELGATVTGKIETGRWYDIRIDVAGDRIRCYLDGKLLHDVTYPRQDQLFAAAGRKGQDVIVKVANPGKWAHESEIRLPGLKAAATKATAVVLSSASPDDENSLDQPTKVAPVDRPVDVSGSSIRFNFPPHSVSVLRVSGPSL